MSLDLVSDLCVSNAGAPRESMCPCGYKRPAADSWSKKDWVEARFDPVDLDSTFNVGCVANVRLTHSLLCSKCQVVHVHHLTHFRCILGKQNAPLYVSGGFQ